MREICILDAKTLGPDMNLDPLEQWGRLQVYATTAPQETAERIADSEIVISNKVLLNESTLKGASQLKLICVAATGTNNVDLAYTACRGITVCNAAGYSTSSVVQHTFALLFYLLQSPAYYDNYVKSGQYSSNDIFTHLDRPFWELAGRTWGIIGLGTIGRSVADIARAFGCRVIYYSTSDVDRSADYQRTDLDELLREADIISIHAPLNEKTLNLIDAGKFKLMKKNALLLNLGRGGIVNEEELAAALNAGCLAGAGLDVLENEPLKRDNPLLHLDKPEKLLITPHIAWASQEARARLIEEISLNISGFLAGSPRNVVI